MFRFLLPFLALIAIASAQPVLDHEQDHIELRAMKNRLVEAVTKGDVSAIERDLHPNVVITWQNNVVCRGRDGVRKFYEEMKASDQKFEGYKLPPTADEPTILYSGATTGVVFGDNVGHFYLLGKEFEMPNRWTAMVVKENGVWQLAAYHVSMNVTDNPLLNAAKKSASVGFGIALVIGVFLGWFFYHKKTQRAARISGRA